MHQGLDEATGPARTSWAHLRDWGAICQRIIKLAITHHDISTTQGLQADTLPGNFKKASRTVPPNRRHVTCTRDIGPDPERRLPLLGSPTALLRLQPSPESERMASATPRSRFKKSLWAREKGAPCPLLAAISTFIIAQIHFFQTCLPSTSMHCRLAGRPAQRTN